MLKSHLIFLCLFLSAPSFAAITASEPGFSSYTREYAQPSFFSHNDTAFFARLKLLDSAPAGAHARIATFAFDNGVAVRQLARHVCLAALRGVQVDFLIDGKSGSAPGKPGTFDKSDNAQVADDLLQYMANCGASVYVHNELESYVEVFGSRVPNFFLDPKFEHRKLGLVHVFLILQQINYLFDRAGALVENEFSRAGVSVETKPFLKHLRDLAVQFVVYMASGSNEPSARGLAAAFEKLLRDPIWEQVTSGQLRALLPKLEARFRSDADFSQLIEIVRRFNRLNHRKLFLVENGQAGCMLLGGRNLGDRYLVDSAHSFLDGDVMLCRAPGTEAAFDEARASFENLKTDLGDPFLNSRGDNRVLKVAANRNFVFSNLLIPRGLGIPGLQRGQDYQGKLSDEERTLLGAKVWHDPGSVRADVELGGSVSWRTLVSGWDRSLDEVRAALLAAIAAEKKEIYIETAYAEFDEELRHAIENALQRGVHVELITNSLLTLDGPSKAIRLLMMNWMESTGIRYPVLFNAKYTSMVGGHMTHFKGAAFGCQPDSSRFYLVGSHNFHPRSGYMDKEHMLAWSEPGDGNTPLASVSLVKARHDFYDSLSSSSHHRVLDKYPDLLKELSDAIRANPPGDTSGTHLAQAMRAMLFEKAPKGNFEMRDGQRLRNFLKFLDESGLHDFLGRIL